MKALSTNDTHSTFDALERRLVMMATLLVCCVRAMLRFGTNVCCSSVASRQVATSVGAEAAVRGDGADALRHGASGVDGTDRQCPTPLLRLAKLQHAARTRCQDLI